MCCSVRCVFPNLNILLTKNDLLNLSIFFIIVENVLGFWQEIVGQWNKMQEILLGMGEDGTFHKYGVI